MALIRQRKDGPSSHHLLWNAKQNTVEAILSTNYKTSRQGVLIRLSEYSDCCTVHGLGLHAERCPTKNARL